MEQNIKEKQIYLEIALLTSIPINIIHIERKVIKYRQHLQRERKEIHH